MNAMAKTFRGPRVPDPSSLPHRDKTTASEMVVTTNGIGVTDGKNLVEPIPVRTPLSAAGKRRCVELWATFHTLSQVRDTMAKECGFPIPDSTLLHYDPTRPGNKLHPKLKAYHAEVRKEYIERSANVAIAHQAHRLRKLENIIESATKSKDYTAALKGIELAAKEMGGLTQTVRHEGRVEQAHLHVHGTTEDMRTELAMRLAALADTVAPTVVEALPVPSVGQSVGTRDAEDGENPVSSGT